LHLLDLGLGLGLETAGLGLGLGLSLTTTGLDYKGADRCDQMHYHAAFRDGDKLCMFVR